MRPSPIRIAAAGAVAMVGAAIAIPGQASATGPSAQAEYNAAIKAAGTQGVHFASTAAESGTTIQVSGDTGATSGAQTLVVRKGNVSEHVNTLVVGSTGYLKANATALRNVIGLSTSQASKYAGKWLSFPTSNASLGQLVGGLKNSQVAGELGMSGPFTYGTATTVGGHQAVAIKGAVSTNSGTSVPVVLYVASSGKPLPLQEVTNPGAASSSAIHGVVTFTHWGEKTQEKAPSSSVSLLKLIPSQTTPAG